MHLYLLDDGSPLYAYCATGMTFNLTIQALIVHSSNFTVFPMTQQAPPRYQSKIIRTYFIFDLLRSVFSPFTSLRGYEGMFSGSAVNYKSAPYHPLYSRFKAVPSAFVNVPYEQVMTHSLPRFPWDVSKCLQIDMIGHNSFKFIFLRVISTLWKLSLSTWYSFLFESSAKIIYTPCQSKGSLQSNPFVSVLQFHWWHGNVAGIAMNLLHGKLLLFLETGVTSIVLMGFWD